MAVRRGKLVVAYNMSYAALQTWWWATAMVFERHVWLAMGFEQPPPKNQRWLINLPAKNTNELHPPARPLVRSPGCSSAPWHVGRSALHCVCQRK